MWFISWVLLFFDGATRILVNININIHPFADDYFCVFIKAYNSSETKTHIFDGAKHNESKIVNAFQH